MRAMVLDGPGQPLRLAELPCPVPQAGQLLLAVQACGVCRTDLHLRDGELPDAVSGAFGVGCGDIQRQTQGKGADEGQKAGAGKQQFL